MSRLRTLLFASLIAASSGANLSLAQTSAVARLAVQSGNGQLNCPACNGATLQAFQPISVRATDASGNPVAGASVTWTVTSGQITFANSATTGTSTTDGTGVATINIGLVLPSYFTTPFAPYLVSTIQATSNSNSAIFTETLDLITTAGISVLSANAPILGGAPLTNGLSANSGTILSTPLQVQLTALEAASAGLPAASISILNEQPSPSLSCVNQGGYADPGTVLSDSLGNSSCKLVFSGSGPGTFYVLVGGVPGPIHSDTGAPDIATALDLQRFGPYTFTSNPGTPSGLQIVSGNNQVGAIGQTLNPLVARLVDANGNPVQGQTMVWSVLPAGAVALGLGGTLTDNNGLVSISATLGQLASAGAAITVAAQSNPNISVTFQVSIQGALTAMTKISGDNQTAQVGTTFAAPLVVQVSNASGPAVNFPVQYLVSGPVTLVGGTTVGTNSSGQASVTVTAGNVPGTATVTAVAGALTKAFALTITSGPIGPTPTGISIINGNPQSAIIGSQFSQPLVVQVVSASGPVSGVSVGFSASGGVTLSSGAATTNSSGQASVNVTAGNTPGTATVTATISTFSTTFNLTVTGQGPQITAASFLNAASRQVGQLSPCSLAILTAAGLTPDGAADLTTGPIFGRWPKNVNHLTVTFGGIPAPIKSVVMGATNPEVTLQVPCEVAPATSVPVVVNVNGGGTATTNIPIYNVSPGIFQQVMSDGTNRAVAVRSDGSFADIGNPDTYDPTNPVRPGETVRFYLTGLGITSPEVATDSIENPNAYLYAVDATVMGVMTAGFAGSNVVMQVVSARQAPGLIGVYELQVTIPSNAPTGNNVPFYIGITPQGSTSTTPIFAPNSTVPISQ